MVDLPRFFHSSGFFFHRSSDSPLRRVPRTLLNCLPLVFTPVPLRYGPSTEEALRDTHGAARVGRIKTARGIGEREDKPDPPITLVPPFLYRYPRLDSPAIRETPFRGVSAQLRHVRRPRVARADVRGRRDELGGISQVGRC